MFTNIVKKIALVLISAVAFLQAEVTFGVISTVSPTEDAKKVAPLLKYLSDELGDKVVFATGKNYGDTIQKFNSGEFQIGMIGPSPYILATKDSDNLDVIAGFETDGKPFFHGVIIASKSNDKVNSLEDLAGQKFAFGSRKSTLSFYTPAKALLDSGVKDKLAGFDFLGKHDAVAKAVIGKKYAAGGIKEDVANKYAKHLKVISKSEPIYDFMVIAHKSTPDALKQKLKTALLKLKDPKILGSIKKGMTGFVETSSANYTNLREMMKTVDASYPAK